MLFIALTFITVGLALSLFFLLLLSLSEHLSFGLAYGSAALFVLLRLEQAALVIGSLLLFALLAAVMTLTRRLDWYKLGAGTTPTLSTR
ncbi:inner membrane CreD family protein [Roseateles microcysteis]|uniref:inner membrane CreD family protein n=1 Tax=Roseateles microcysteis TaxID=3119057 RepID=UPI003A7F6035